MLNLTCLQITVAYANCLFSLICGLQYEDKFSLIMIACLSGK